MKTFPPFFKQNFKTFQKACILFFGTIAIISVFASCTADEMETEVVQKAVILTEVYSRDKDSIPPIDKDGTGAIDPPKGTPTTPPPPPPPPGSPSH